MSLKQPQISYRITIILRWQHHRLSDFPVHFPADDSKQSWEFRQSCRTEWSSIRSFSNGYIFERYLLPKS